LVILWTVGFVGGLAIILYSGVGGWIMRTASGGAVDEIAKKATAKNKKKKQAKRAFNYYG